MSGIVLIKKLYATLTDLSPLMTNICIDQGFPNWWFKPLRLGLSEVNIKKILIFVAVLTFEFVLRVISITIYYLKYNKCLVYF